MTPVTPEQAAREACASTARLAVFMQEAARKTADQLAQLRALRAADSVMTERRDT